MKPRVLLITAASWEERFIKGAERVAGQREFSDVICYWYKEFEELTTKARNGFAELYPLARFVELRMHTLPRDVDVDARPAYATTWVRIWEELRGRVDQFDEFVLDITTMPREAIWISLDLLTEARRPGRIVYHRALDHGSWCGSEPEPPHIVPKLGGEPAMNLPTKLLIISGADDDRSQQFVNAFEPSETLLLFQQPSAVHGDLSHVLQSDALPKGSGRLDRLSRHGIDCYTPDWGFSRLLEEASSFGEAANLLMASLGPKTSAVSLYRVQRNLKRSALAYAPCRTYNDSYSTGIGDSLELAWPRSV